MSDDLIERLSKTGVLRICDSGESARRVAMLAPLLAHLDRTATTPPGSRQRHILAWLRLHEQHGPRPISAAHIATGIGYRHGPSDVQWSLTGLAVRGLVERRGPRTGPATWTLTQAGWAAE